jgi:hypothetical protein
VPDESGRGDHFRKPHSVAARNQRRGRSLFLDAPTSAPNHRERAALNATTPKPATHQLRQETRARARTQL